VEVQIIGPRVCFDRSSEPTCIEIGHSGRRHVETDGQICYANANLMRALSVSRGEQIKRV
jgi:hypothetical protein